MPRTTAINSELVTGGTDSYITGYHNNPVITTSNTERGYHRNEHRIVPVNFTNERVRSTITINKSDMDYLNCRTKGDNNQDFIPQGDASLAGAVYGLYANAGIIRLIIFPVHFVHSWETSPTPVFMCFPSVFTFWG